LQCHLLNISVQIFGSLEGGLQLCIGSRAT
jgi:hypothetical protein